ncbi:DUF5667 domain-containing protein [Actinoplanes sp. KI2]|uniref:DUF5667 domain-containing protein n=1 Tax=Actinoplanes sp. KI2 TaxID=2983315 RepID=UPI0021D5ED66|nr:DUF5667 domain-containing protein [Actinoplanes sp. KI2]MCU7730159.1 DUF5667 domain-containing protein [Actinoplanes sp. KI2]
MNFDFLDRRSAERFAELLDENTGGRRFGHDPADERLAELVAIGHGLRGTRPEVPVDSEFRVGLRAMLVATAERGGLEGSGPEESAPAAAPKSRDGVLGRGGRRIRARGAIVMGVAAGALAVSGISAASENASPGDALYGVKRSTERAQLAMAGSDLSRGQLSLDFARTRLTEAASMAGDAAGFGRVLDDMDLDTRQGVKLLDTSAVARQDVKPLATIDKFVNRQRQALIPVMDRLSPASQERAASSLALLDAAGRRADDLRAGLNCSTVISAGADELGPKLRDCTTNASGAATGRSGERSGKSSPRDSREAKVKPARPNPAVTPDATAAAHPDAPASSAPALPHGATPTASATPTVTSTDDTDDSAGVPFWDFDDQ